MAEKGKSPESVVRDIKRKTRRVFNAEEKIRIILERLITSPAYAIQTAADEHQHKTRWINEMWQTNFTFFKIIGWGWYHPSTILDDYYLPQELETQIAPWVDYYNNRRYHESLGNITPCDKYAGREKRIFKERRKVKERKMQLRRNMRRIYT